MEFQDQSAETLPVETQESSSDNQIPKEDTAAKAILESAKGQSEGPVGEPMQADDIYTITSPRESGISESEKETTFKFPILILQQDESGNLQRENEELEIDLDKLTIQAGSGMSISQESFRYAGPCEFTSKATSPELFVLSYRAFIEHHYIFFQSLNERDAEILEKFKQFRNKTLLKFQRTPPVDIWKFLPVQPLFSGKIRMSVLELDTSPDAAEEEEYFLITDVESMALFKTFPQTVPNHVALFFQDPGSNVVETIRRINSAEISIQTYEKQFVIKEQGPHVEKFVSCLKETKSKPGFFLTRPESMLDFYDGVRKPPPTMLLKSPPRTRHSPVRSDIPEREKRDQEEEAETSWSDTASAQVAVNMNHESQLKELQEQMQSALEQFQGNEEFQALWIVAETELKVLDESGIVPVTEMDSAGLDQNNSDHLCKAFADIEDQLKEERLDVALSRLKACRSVFIYSALHRARDIFREDNFTILKKLFFKRYIF